MKHTRTFFLQVILILISCVMIFPFVWMMSAAFKMDKDIFEFPIRFIPKDPTVNNFLAVFTKKEGFDFGLFFFNTMYISVAVTILQVITSSMAAYAFAKLKFPGKDTLFMIYLSNLMIPFQVTVIPLFVIMRYLGWTNNHISLIAIAAFSAFGVFLMRQFYMTIPNELSESAKIDGCGNFGIYLKILLPNIKPAIATLVIFTFIGRWNDFQGPYIFLSSKSKYTIVLGLKMFVSEFNIEYGKIMAGAAVALIPIIILYILLQRYFVEGVATTGIKG